MFQSGVQGIYPDSLLSDTYYTVLQTHAFDSRSLTNHVQRPATRSLNRLLTTICLRSISATGRAAVFARECLGSITATATVKLAAVYTHDRIAIRSKRLPADVCC